MPRRKDDHPRFLRYLELREPAWAPIEKLAREVYPGRSMQVVVQELIRMGLSQDPFQPAVHTARRAAYAAASVQVRVALAKALREIAEAMEASATLEANDLGMPASSSSTYPVPEAPGVHHTGEYFQP